MIRFSVHPYPHGTRRGPLAYYKRPGILRLQWVRRGVLIVWWRRLPLGSVV